MPKATLHDSLLDMAACNRPCRQMSVRPGPYNSGEAVLCPPLRCFPVCVGYQFQWIAH